MLFVERKFEIIGEALAQARHHHPGALEIFEGQKEIVAFRNRVIHGYFAVNDALVWSTVKVYLPSLIAEIQSALGKLPLNLD